MEKTVEIARLCVGPAFYFGLGAQEVVGLESQGVGEISFQGQLPAERMDFRGLRIPIIFVEEVNIFSFEGVLVIYEAFAEQPYRLGVSGESVEEL